MLHTLIWIVCYCRGVGECNLKNFVRFLHGLLFCSLWSSPVLHSCLCRYKLWIDMKVRMTWWSLICTRTQAMWACSAFFYHLIYITQYLCKNTRSVWQEGFWFEIAVSKTDPSIFLQENVHLESWILELRARKILGIVFSWTSIAFLIFCNNPVASGCEFMDHLPTVFEQTILPALGIVPQLTIWWDHDSITWPPHVVSVKRFIENWQDIRARTYCSMQPWILAGLQHLVSKLHLACKSQTNRTGWCHRKL